MSLIGNCQSGCREERLDLVRADALEAVEGLSERSRRRSVALRELVEALTHQRVAENGWEPALRAKQAAARELLHEHPDADAGHADLTEPAEPVITWWCPDCSGLDAPQECLAICIWKPVEWVRAELYERERERALRQRADEAALRALVIRLALSRPRDGQWEVNWKAFQTQARRHLGSPAAV